MKAARGSKDKPARAGKVQSRSAGPGKLPDLRGLSDADLSALVGRVEQEQAARRERKRKEFLASVREQAHALGVAAEEVAAALGRKQAPRQASDRRRTVAPKYRNPGNPSETWAGRGVKPKWMQALLAQGKTMDDFKIVS